MKPNRPDSAKSAKTRITIDSEATTNNITQSRFSETYSNGVKLGANKNGEFEKYVAQKDKDPKFKRFLESNLPQIPEKLKPSAELTKLTSKPFQRKASKADKQKPEPKAEEPAKKPESESKGVKKQNLQSSKTFIDKSKQKLKIASKQQIDEVGKTNGKEESNKNIENQQKQNGTKPKINLNGFVLNIPGKPPQIIKEQKVQSKQKQEQQKKRIQRQKMFTQLSEYVSEMEERNVDYLPKRYDEFIQRNFGNPDVEIQKLNIQDFLQQPNQKDYQNMFKKIKQNEKALQSNQKSSNGPNKSQYGSSINLDEIIDGSEKKQEQEADDVSVIMSSMTASDVRDRNMFLTQILKGKRLTQEQLSQIKQNNDTMVKLIKIEGTSKQQEAQDDDVQMVQINMSKKRSNKFMERNKREAVGDLFRQCDYLTPEEQQRIQDLINGAKIESPFQQTQMERLMSRRIDEGIKLHRQLCRSIEGSSDAADNDIVIDEETLPKDPNLRKKAELKILREKVHSVNSRLGCLNEIVINKAKIQSLIEKYKDSVRPSKMSESLIQQKRRQIEQQNEQLKIAQSLLKKVQNEKQQMLQLVDEMVRKFGSMEEDVLKIQKMDHEQRRKMELSELKQKRKRVDEIQKQALQFEHEVEAIIQEGEEIKRKMEILDQIISVKNQQIKCEGYQDGQTIQDLDALITKKWEAAEEALRIVRDQDN